LKKKKIEIRKQITILKKEKEKERKWKER